MARMAEETNMGCWVFLRRPSSLSRLGYGMLPQEGDGCCDGPSPAAVTVVVGREKREFLVDAWVLEKDFFRVLMEMMCKDWKEEGGIKWRRRRSQDVIFLDVDAMLFEHMLWLVHNDCCSSSSIFQLNIKDIIEFYSQDS